MENNNQIVVCKSVIEQLQIELDEVNAKLAEANTQNE
jgi:hypothetical protein